MARVSAAVVSALAGFLTGDNGLPGRIGKLVQSGELAVPTMSDNDILQRHVPSEAAEKGLDVRYPSVHIYCEEVANELREKFRKFSGTADLVLDVRVSHEHIERLQGVLEAYVESATDILDERRGSWGAGMFYTGGYKIQFGPVKRGGRNFLQSAKVQLTVQISME